MVILHSHEIQMCQFIQESEYKILRKPLKTFDIHLFKGEGNMQALITELMRLNYMECRNDTTCE